MDISRRSFFGIVGTGLGGVIAGKAGRAHGAQTRKDPLSPYGCLVDLTLCVGCRKCELACNQVNHLPEPDVPFDDPRPLDSPRRPDEKAYTVVNRYFTGRLDERNTLIPTYVKVQCMHCHDPACASACIVGALTKQENGAVHYDVSKCIGCRYCMIACPFQIPAYEYFDPITPEVRKCTFCFERISKKGGRPGCADICPVEAITFGKRSDMLALARERISKDPGRYIDHIYGEHEVGGTSWLYISRETFHKVGFLKLPHTPPPRLTETIQHGIFGYLWAPIVLFGVLGATMWGLNRKQITRESTSDSAHHKEDAS
ncbi:MAG: 4Fe-4S dicluster domain-containing protein [Deltaproteobacteria bacterium]|nr:4Fe-4S dicluster domain-containing protein [Deltaproteobacteria bacterium]